jgi:hypothetical protein
MRSEVGSRKQTRIVILHSHTYGAHTYICLYDMDVLCSDIDDESVRNGVAPTRDAAVGAVHRRRTAGAGVWNGRHPRFTAWLERDCISRV